MPGMDMPSGRPSRLPMSFIFSCMPDTDLHDMHEISRCGQLIFSMQETRPQATVVAAAPTSVAKDAQH